MLGDLKPYIPELTIRDYNTYLWYQRGVCRQMYLFYGFYACRRLREEGVLFAMLSDSLAGRIATCQNELIPGTISWRPAMSQTLGIRQASQIEVLLAWHGLQDMKYSELDGLQSIQRALDSHFMRRAYERAVRENPSLERIFVQERAQAIAQMELQTKNYDEAAEPTSNIYAAMFSLLGSDDPGQRKRLHYIGGCVGRALYLLAKAERVEYDVSINRYNVFIANGITSNEAARENARRQALAAANDLVRAYGMLDVKLYRSLLDNIMILGVRHAVDPFDKNEKVDNWELP